MFYAEGGMDVGVFNRMSKKQCCKQKDPNTNLSSTVYQHSTGPFLDTFLNCSIRMFNSLITPQTLKKPSDILLIF